MTFPSSETDALYARLGEAWEHHAPLEETASVVRACAALYDAGLPSPGELAMRARLVQYLGMAMRRQLLAALHTRAVAAFVDELVARSSDGRRGRVPTLPPAGVDVPQVRAWLESGPEALAGAPEVRALIFVLLNQVEAADRLMGGSSWRGC